MEHPHPVSTAKVTVVQVVTVTFPLLQPSKALAFPPGVPGDQDGSLMRWAEGGTEAPSRAAFTASLRPGGWGGASGGNLPVLGAGRREAGAKGGCGPASEKDPQVGLGGGDSPLYRR